VLMNRRLASMLSITVIGISIFSMTPADRTIAANVGTHNVIYTFSPSKITIVDPKTMQAASIPETNIAWGDVLVSPDRKLVFANDRTHNAVQVISVDSMKVIKSIPVGERPVHSYNPKGGKEIWTHSDIEGTFYVIDIASLAVTHKVLAATDSKKGGHGKLLWSAQLGDKAYATNVNDRNLHVLSLSQYRETGTIDTGCKGTHGHSYNIPTKTVYIACNDGHVVVIDPATDGVLTTLAGGSQVWPGAHDEWMSEDSPYLVSPTPDDMKIIDTAARMNVGSIAVNDTGYVVVRRLAGKTVAFAAGNKMPFVYVMDVKSMKVLKQINVNSPTAGQPEGNEGGGDILDRGDTLYVVRANDGLLTLLDMKELRVLRSLFIEIGVNHVVYVQ
jgi:DNA-binding beta-propeller fold protein YncE